MINFYEVKKQVGEGDLNKAIASKFNRTYAKITKKLNLSNRQDAKNAKSS
jgi:hypothetical protein